MLQLLLVGSNTNQDFNIHFCDTFLTFLLLLYYYKFIVENLDEALYLPAPPPINPRQSSYKDQKGRKWSIGTLNRVLRDVLVPLADGTQIAVIGCAEWESENFAGVTNLHVRTLDMFRGSHRQVVILCNYFILFHTFS